MASSNILPSLSALAVPVTNLEHLDRNPRRGDVAAVARSYKRFGQRKPIVARRTGENEAGPTGTVLAGNHQLAAAISLDWDSIAVVFVDDDEATAQAYALADNRTAELGGFDEKLLSEVLSELEAVDASLIEAASYSDLLKNGATENRTPTDPASEWENMPDFEQEDKLSAYHTTVHFATEAAALKFFKLIGQDKRSSTWWPTGDGLKGSDVKLQYISEEEKEEDA